jgi:hypothetical protein
MPLAFIAAIAGAILGLIFGGSLDSLSRTRFRWTVLLFIGLAIQVLFTVWKPEWAQGKPELWLLLASNLAVAIFMVLNWRLPGMWLAAAGLLMNIAVIAANGAMPVSTSAAEAIGGEGPPATGVFKHEAMTDDTRLRWLGDVLPVKPLGSVFSPGDIVLAAGIFYLVFARTKFTAGKHSADPAGRREPGKHSFKRSERDEEEPEVQVTEEELV